MVGVVQIHGRHPVSCTPINMGLLLTTPVILLAAPQVVAGENCREKCGNQHNDIISSMTWKWHHLTGHGLSFDHRVVSLAVQFVPFGLH